jgi:hypothetical protein
MEGPMNPLFIANIDELKANLRLSGASTLPGTDFDYLLDQAIRKARLVFRRRLGQKRIETVQGYSQDSSPIDPDTDHEYYREMAELAEIDMVKLELTYLLPMLFMDAGASNREVYNDEAAFRKAVQEDLKALRSQLKAVIDQNLRGLNTLDISGPNANNFFSIGPDEPTLPGQSIR